MPSLRVLTASLACSTLGLAAFLPTPAHGFQSRAGQEGTPRSRAVREIIVPDVAGTRSEYFRLDLTSGVDASAGTGDEPFGLVRWIGGRIDDDPNGWRNEQEVFLFEQKTQISLVERLSHEERVLSYREIRARTGRRLHFSWTPDGRAETSDSDGRTGYRREFDLRSGAVLPLALLELARRDRLAPGIQSVFAPRMAGCEALRITLERTDDRRLYALLFEDGTSAGCYAFRGRELLWFRWQSGGALATRIEEDEFESRKNGFSERRRPSEELFESGLLKPLTGVPREQLRRRRD